MGNLNTNTKTELPFQSKYEDIWEQQAMTRREEALM